MAWVFNNARGSVFVAMLLHAVNNTIGGAYVGQLLHGDDLSAWRWIFTVLLMLTAAVIAWRAGPSLVSKRAAWGDVAHAANPSPPGVPLAGRA